MSHTHTHGKEKISVAPHPGEVPPSGPPTVNRRLEQGWTSSAVAHTSWGHWAWRITWQALIVVKTGSVPLCLQIDQTRGGKKTRKEHMLTRRWHGSESDFLRVKAVGWPDEESSILFGKWLVNSILIIKGHKRRLANGQSGKKLPDLSRPLSSILPQSADARLRWTGDWNSQQTQK